MPSELNLDYSLLAPEFCLAALAAFVLGVDGAVLQMFAHGVMTALMFSMVGALYDQAHVRDMTIFGGLVRAMPRQTAFFAIAGLSSLGLPGLAGFIAEFYIFVGTIQAGYYWAGALGILAAAITATYILRMLALAYFGPFNERWAGLKEMRLGEQFAGALLIIFIAFMGIWPAPFIDRISATVDRLQGWAYEPGMVTPRPGVRPGGLGRNADPPGPFPGGPSSQVSRLHRGGGRHGGNADIPHLAQ